MPLKKKGAQATLESEDFAEESEMSVSSPLSSASTMSGAVTVLSVEALQTILANNQASMLENQRMLQHERAEQQHKFESENRLAMKAMIEAIPTSGSAAPRKIRVDVPKWSESEVPHEFLRKYEVAQIHNGVEKCEWGLLLQVYLTGTAQAAYNQLEPALYRDYDLLKVNLLKALKDTTEQADRNWWALAKRHDESFGAFVVRMRSTATRRFEDCFTREEVVEKVILSRFLYSLQSEQYSAVTLKEPKSAMEAASALDDLVSRNDFAKNHLRNSDRVDQPYGRREYGHRTHQGYRNDISSPTSGRSSPSDRRSPSPTQAVVPSSGNQAQEPAVSERVIPNPSTQNGSNNQGGFGGHGRPRQIICHSCGEPGHIKPNCPYRVRRIFSSDLDSESDEPGDEEEKSEPNYVNGRIAGKMTVGMRYDSGCDRTVVDKSLVPVESYIGRQIVLKGWRGNNSSTHELAKVDILVGNVVHKRKKVAVAEDMDYPALLGADLSRAMRIEIMERVMEEWKSEGEVKHAQEEVKMEAVRVIRAQAQTQKEVELGDVFDFGEDFFEQYDAAPLVGLVSCTVEAEQADDQASEDSESTPVALEDIFGFEDDFFEQSDASPLVEIDSSQLEDESVGSSLVGFAADPMIVFEEKFSSMKDAKETTEAKEAMEPTLLGKEQPEKLCFLVQPAEGLLDKLIHNDQLFCRVYTDESVVFSTSWEQHCLHFNSVLERLRTAGLTASEEECQWRQSMFDFWGHMVGKDVLDYDAHSFYFMNATRKSAPYRVVWCYVMSTEYCYVKTVLFSTPSLTFPSAKDNFVRLMLGRGFEVEESLGESVGCQRPSEEGGGVMPRANTEAEPQPG